MPDDPIPHSYEIHERLNSVERGLSSLRSEIAGEDRVTVLRIDALEAEARSLRSEIDSQEVEVKMALRGKVDRDRYDIFERALLAFIGVTTLSVLGAVLAQVIIQPGVTP